MVLSNFRTSYWIHLHLFCIKRQIWEPTNCSGSSDDESLVAILSGNCVNRRLWALKFLKQCLRLCLFYSSIKIFILISVDFLIRLIARENNLCTSLLNSSSPKFTFSFQNFRSEFSSNLPRWNYCTFFISI